MTRMRPAASRPLASRRLTLRPLTAGWTGRDSLKYVIELKRTRRCAGVISLHAIDWASRTAELGTWLEPAARGRGIGLGAKRLLLHHAFGDLGLHGVRFYTAAENIRARRALERLGAVDEGAIVTHPGRGAPTLHRYSIWRDDF